MANYRCYFFGPKLTASDNCSVDPAQDFWAESDEHARMTAESMYDLFRDQTSGFEVWQGGRLVCREVVPSSETMGAVY